MARRALAAAAHPRRIGRPLRACIAVPISSSSATRKIVALARPSATSVHRLVEQSQMQTKASSAALNDLQIEPIDRSLEPQFRARIDGKAKPLGSLGRLEDLAVHSAWSGIHRPRAP